MTRNMIFFSSQKQFFLKNWQSLSLLSIFELKVKQAVLLSMQIFLRTWQEHSFGSSIILHNYPPSQSFYFPAQFYFKITLCVFFFLHPSSKAQLTWRYCKIFNSSYQESYLYKFRDRHILHSSRIKLAFFNKP